MLTKCRTPFALLAATLFLASAHTACAGEPEKTRRIPDMLPESTIMLVHVAPWEQWANDFRQTAPAKILDEAEVRAFLEGPWNRLTAPTPPKRTEPAQPAAEGRAPAAPGVAGEFLAGTKAFCEMLGNMVQSIRNIKLEKPLADMLDSMARGPLTIAVRYSPEDARTNKMPGIIAIVGNGYPKDADEKLRALVDSLKNKEWRPPLFNTELATVKVTVDALSMTPKHGANLLSIAPIHDGKRINLLTVTFFKDRLLISNDEDLCTEVVDGMSGTLNKSLRDSPLFKECGLAGDEHLMVFLDLPSLQKAMPSLQKAMAAAQPAKTHLASFLEQAGLNKATAVASSLKLNGLAFESRTAILGERQGILGKLPEGQLSNDTLKIFPAGTPFATAFRLRPGGVLPFVRGVFGTMQGEKGLENFNAVEKELAGRNLEKEFGEAFGSEVAIASLAAQADSGGVVAIPACAVGLAVKDKALASKLLDDLLPRLANKADAAGGGLKKVEGPVVIRYYNASTAGGLLGVSPAFALLDDRLLIAVDVPSAKNAIHVIQKGPWLDKSPVFTQALQDSGGPLGSAFTYVDWAYIYKSVFSVGTRALSMINSTGVLTRSGIDLNLLPSTEAVAGNLCPGLSVVRVANNKVVLTSRSPLPSVEVLTPPLAGVTAALAGFWNAAPPPEQKK